MFCRIGEAIREARATVKAVKNASADMPAVEAARLFAKMNHSKVHFLEWSEDFDVDGTIVLFDGVRVEDLRFPRGWYCAKGTLRNKHNTSHGFYQEIRMIYLSGVPVDGSAGYLPRK